MPHDNSIIIFSFAQCYFSIRKSKCYLLSVRWLILKQTRKIGHHDMQKIGETNKDSLRYLEDI